MELDMDQLRGNEFVTKPTIHSGGIKFFPSARCPHAVKFEDRSQEEIERQERCARGDAWRLAKNILKLKETDKATFFSPTNEWSLQAPSTKNRRKENLL